MTARLFLCCVLIGCTHQSLPAAPDLLLINPSPDGYAPQVGCYPNNVTVQVDGGYIYAHADRVVWNCKSVGGEPRGLYSSNEIAEGYLTLAYEFSWSHTPKSIVWSPAYKSQYIGGMLQSLVRLDVTW